MSLSATYLFGPTTTWIWTIYGGTPYSARTVTTASPSITLTNPGSYTVSLQAANNAGWSAVKTAKVTVKPTPTNYVQPTIHQAIQEPNNMYKVAEPIEVAIGAYEYKHADLSIHGIKTAVNFTRFYNSVNAAKTNTLGFGWSHSYDYYISHVSDTLWEIHYGDGHISSFIPLANNRSSSFALYGGTYEQLSQDTITGIFSLKFKNGDVYAFNSTNKLASITDLNGNVTTFSYSGSNLASIVAPGGRSLTLAYSGSKLTKVTDPLGRHVDYSYDSNDDLISVSDPNSHSTGFSYFTQHLLKEITTAIGYTLLSNIYDSLGRVTSQSDALGYSTRIAYDVPSLGDQTITNTDSSTRIVHHDAFFRLTHLTDELGHSKTFGYDYNNNLDSVTDENGHLTTYVYDSVGNCISIAQPLSTNTALTFNAFNRPSRVTDAAGHTTNLAYDGNGNILRADLPNTSTRNFSYYTNGLLHTSTDGLSHVTTYTYNTFGDLTSIASPAGTKNFTYDSAGRIQTNMDENNHINSFTYNNTDKIVTTLDAHGAKIIDSFDADGNIISATDENGHTTHFVYDRKDQLTSVIDALGHTKAITYDRRDNIESVTDPNGNSVFLLHDSGNRLISKTNSIGTVRWGYDSVGNMTSVTDALNKTSNFTYDALNRRKTAADALGRTTGYTYSPIGLLGSVTSPSGRRTEYIYDELGLVKQVIDAANHSTYVFYDPNGKKKSLTDANGHTQYFGYDASSRLISTHDASNNLDSFVLDGVGNVTKEIKPTGTIDRTFDEVNNLTNVVNSTGDNYHYVFDSAGMIRAMTNGSGTAYFQYDEVNQLKRYKDVFGNTILYTYDSSGNKKSITYPGGNMVSYAYNADNTLKLVTDWLGNTTNYLYDANGRPKQMQYSNGTVCNYSYNSAGDIDIQTTSIGTTIINQCIPILNPNGERIFETRIGAVPKHFTQDSFINSYLPNDALISDGHSTYVNDNAGNRISETNTSGTTSYSFTVDNILNSITTPSITTRYHTDAMGYRVERVQSGIDRRYVNDPSGNLVEVVMEQDTAGTTKASYIYGLGLIARIDSAGQIQWYHFDPQHNTVALSNTSGHITDTYAYLSSGNMVLHTGNTQQPYTFLGEFGAQLESPSFYFLRARYYDAKQAGRFISKDPYCGSMANPQSLNRYAYGLNNPLSFFDPTGLLCQSDTETPPMMVKGANYAQGTLALIAMDISVPEPTDFVPLKWGAYAVVGTIAAGAIAVEYINSNHIVAKMQSEIDRILQRAEGPQGYVYELVATKDGPYPNVRTGTSTFLNTGSVWKYGETTQSFGRYSQVSLSEKSLSMIPIFTGTQIDIKIQEKVMIYGYFFKHGSLPPGNKIFR